MAYYYITSKSLWIKQSTRIQKLICPLSLTGRIGTLLSFKLRVNLRKILSQSINFCNIMGDEVTCPLQTMSPSMWMQHLKWQITHRWSYEDGGHLQESLAIGCRSQLSLMHWGQSSAFSTQNWHIHSLRMKFLSSQIVWPL